MTKTKEIIERYFLIKKMYDKKYNDEDLINARIQLLNSGFDDVEPEIDFGYYFFEAPFNVVHSDVDALENNKVHA